MKRFGFGADYGVIAEEIFSDSVMDDFIVFKEKYIARNGETFYGKYTASIESLIYFKTIDDIISQYEHWAEQYKNEVLGGSVGFEVYYDTRIYKSNNFSLIYEQSTNHYYVLDCEFSSETREGIYFELNNVIKQLREVEV